MNNLTIQEIHDQCLKTTQGVINGFGWNTISVSVMSHNEKKRLEKGINGSVLNWPWAMNRYRVNTDDGILDISLKVIDHNEPDSLHAVIICRYDERREQFSICMLENFIADIDTALTGNVLIIALVYATTFCGIVELENIYIQNPTDAAMPRYSSYGFAPVWNDLDKISADVADVLETVRAKVNSIYSNE